MNRKTIVLMAMLGVALTAVATGFTGGTNTAVGDFHTSNSDFQNAKTLENVTVANGNVSYRVGEYNVVEDSGDGVAENESFLAGEVSPATNGDTQWKIVPDFTGNITELDVHIATVNNGGPDSPVRVRIAPGNPATNDDSSGTVVQYNWGPPTSTGTNTIVLDTEYEVTAGENYSVIFDTGTVSGTEANNVTISTDGDSGLTGWADGTDGATIDENAGGNITARSAVPDADRAVYVSDNLSVTDPTTGWTNLSALANASATVTWQYHDNGWQDAATNSYTTPGNKTASLSQSADTWRVNVTWQNQSGNGAPVGVLSDDGQQFRNHHPAVDNNSASPTGGAQLSQRDTTVSIQINDSEFSSAQGDTVTIDWYKDGSKADTTTITSNQTASTTLSFPTGGNHTWHVETNDSYGATTVSETFNVTTPGELEVRNETNPSQLVDNVNVTLAIYVNESGTAQILTRNTSDGTINMTGVPADKPFIVTAEAPGYHSRRIFVESLYQTQRIYLLNESIPAVETIFSLEDYTGEFPSEDTVLAVQRGINGTYETVMGDFFGATGQFPATLHDGQRHRLIVQNIQTGAERILGTYTPITASTQTVVITPEGVDRISDAEPHIAVSPQTRVLPAKDAVNLSVRVRNGSSSLSWSATAELVNDSGSTTVWTTSGSGGDVRSTALNLTGRSNATLNLSVTYTTAGGASVTEHHEFAIGSQFDRGASLLGGLGRLANLSPPGSRGAFQNFMAMIVTVLAIGGVATQRVGGEVAGLVGVLVLVGFSVIGWTSYDLVFVATVGLLSFAAIRRGL